MTIISHAMGLDRRNLDEGALRDLVGAGAETLPMRIQGLGLEIAEADRLIRAYEQMAFLSLLPEEWEAMLRHPDLMRQYCREFAAVLSTMLNKPVTVHAEI